MNDLIYKAEAIEICKRCRDWGNILTEIEKMEPVETVPVSSLKDILDYVMMIKAKNYNRDESLDSVASYIRLKIERG